MDEKLMEQIEGPASEKDPITMDAISLGKEDPTATLIHAIAVFNTLDDNKDNTTILESFLNVYPNEPINLTEIPRCVAYLNQTGVEYPDWIQQKVPMTFQAVAPMTFAEARKTTFLVRIRPGQTEEWRFSFTITLVFSDNSVLIGTRDRCKLNNSDTEVLTTFYTVPWFRGTI